MKVLQPYSKRHRLRQYGPGMLDLALKSCESVHSTLKIAERLAKFVLFCRYKPFVYMYTSMFFLGRRRIPLYTLTGSAVAILGLLECGL